MVLKWRDIYTENMRMVLLIAGCKMEGIIKWRGPKSQGPRTVTSVVNQCGTKSSLLIFA